MSLAHHGWALGIKKINTSQRLVLLVLLNYAREQCLCAWPSQKSLSQNTGLGERQVRRVLSQLQQMNFIEISKARTTGKYVGNVYRINTGQELEAHDKNCIQTIGHTCPMDIDNLNLESAKSDTYVSDGHLLDENHRTSMTENLKEKKSDIKEKKRITLNEKKEKVKKEKNWVATLKKVSNAKPTVDWVDMQQRRFSDKVLEDSADSFYTAVEIEKKYKYKQPLSAFMNWCKKEEKRNEEPVNRGFSKGRESVVSKDIDEQTRRFADQQRLRRTKKS